MLAVWEYTWFVVVVVLYVVISFVQLVAFYFLKKNPRKIDHMWSVFVVSFLVFLVVYEPLSLILSRQRNQKRLNQKRLNGLHSRDRVDPKFRTRRLCICYNMYYFQYLSYIDTT